MSIIFVDILIVPHGGYTASLLYRATRVHLKNTHSDWFLSTPESLGFQISYLRRMKIGPAVITVDDIKIGARISTI